MRQILLRDTKEQTENPKPDGKTLVTFFFLGSQTHYYEESSDSAAKVLGTNNEMNVNRG